MRLLNTKHKQKSMAITLVLHVMILLLFFYVGLSYVDPPPENGIAVNFGTMDAGSENVQPKEKIKTAPKQTTPEPVKAQKAEIKEEVVSQDTEEAPVIKKEEKKDVIKEVVKVVSKKESKKEGAKEGEAEGECSGQRHQSPSGEEAATAQTSVLLLWEGTSPRTLCCVPPEPPYVLRLLRMAPLRAQITLDVRIWDAW